MGEAEAERAMMIWLPGEPRSCLAEADLEIDPRWYAPS